MQFTTSPNKMSTNMATYLSYNDRKKILQQEFQSFPGSTSNLTMDQLYEFLDQKMKSRFNRQLGDQIHEIIKNPNNRINLEDFIENFIETEDTINFRLQLDRSQLEEIKQIRDDMLRKKENQIHNLQDDYNNKGVVLINIVQANNLEIPQENAQENKNINAFVLIDYGQLEKLETRSIQNQNNPIWNESFKIQIDPSLEEISIIVTDRRIYQKNYSEIGRVRIFLNEIQDQTTKERTMNLITQEGLKLKSTLQFSIKYVYSKAKIYDEDAKKLNAEINQLELQIKSNEKAIQDLQAPFKNLVSASKIKNEIISINKSFVEEEEEIVEEQQFL